ncbi:hypothetical protein A0H76_1190 [Hepatospora eriocheir]|uniref:Uncharacterized protein n=1 Tax=Hepatospora eriocheir TaxID=1081669 RepID=A0A1X0QHI7_9MICR|nr:hypothetical protein A0H76_1190 [Hepatospora eriocheir]
MKEIKDEMCLLKEQTYLEKDKFKHVYNFKKEDNDPLRFLKNIKLSDSFLCDIASDLKSFVDCKNDSYIKEEFEYDMVYYLNLIEACFGEKQIEVDCKSREAFFIYLNNLKFFVSVYRFFELDFKKLNDFLELL